MTGWAWEEAYSICSNLSNWTHAWKPGPFPSIETKNWKTHGNEDVKLSSSSFPVYRLNWCDQDLGTCFRFGFARAIEFTFLNSDHSDQLRWKIEKKWEQLRLLWFPQVFKIFHLNWGNGLGFEAWVRLLILKQIESASYQAQPSYHLGWDFGRKRNISVVKLFNF